MEDLLQPTTAIHIPLASPATASTLLQVHGRGGITRRQLPSAPASLAGQHYSSHVCVGDVSDLKPKAQRACLFQRICLDTRTGDWRYHRRANVSLPPVLFERRYGSQFSFRHVAPRGTEEFLALNKHVRYKPHVRWSPSVVDGPAPSASSGVIWRSGVHLLSAPFVPTNLGHLVWEESFPLLLAMVQLNTYDERAVVLRTHACNQSVSGESPTASEARLCAKFVAGFVAPLQGREHAAVEDVQALRARHWPRTVCFGKLVAGGFFDMFNSLHHAGKEPFLGLFRRRVLAFHGVSLAPRRRTSDGGRACTARCAPPPRRPSAARPPHAADGLPRAAGRRSTCCCSSRSRGGAASTTSTRCSSTCAASAPGCARGSPRRSRWPSTS